MIDGLTEGDFEFYAEHFNRQDPREPILRETAVRELSEKCPVVHSDEWGGYWVINQYEAAMSVYHDWEGFSSVPDKRADGPQRAAPMPPVDVDPPIQRDFRHLLNPYLTPRRIARFEPQIRTLVTELIDDFIEDGHCELAGQLAKALPGRMLYRHILGLDEAEVETVQGWSYLTVFDPRGPDTPAASHKFDVWVREMISRRRSEPRQDDLIDGLLHGTVDNRPLDNEEIAGCIEILILGGFGTTTDAILSIMNRMANDKSIQEHLRSNPSQIPKTLDEFLRFDPPVGGTYRLCTRDTVVDDKAIKAGDRVFLFFHAANRDPSEFDDPNTLDIEREQNRHLSFGAGMHRCIGSNVARANLKVALEELLARLGEFSMAPGQAPVRTWRSIDALPLVFTPGDRRISTQ